MDEKLRIGRVWALAAAVIRANLALMLLIAMPLALLHSGTGLGLRIAMPVYGAQLLGALVSAVTGGMITAVAALAAVANVEGRRAPLGVIVSNAAYRAPGVIGTGLLYNLGVGAAGLLFVVPGIILAVRWMVATPASAVEGLGAQSALGRAGTLGEGNRLAMLAIGAIDLLLLIVPSVVLGAGLAARHGQPDATAWLGVALTAPATVLIKVVVAALYVELVRLKEGARPGYLAEVFA